GDLLHPVMPIETLGYCRNSAEEQCEYLHLAFSPLSAPLQSRWRNNGLSADFLGDYVTTFLPTASESMDAAAQQAIRHAVTYIANELLENAMKYHERTVDVPIGIYLELSKESITIRATNGVNPAQARQYREFVERILKEDAGELLVRQLENNSGEAPTQKSCLGLLTILTDYSARMGWEFESDPAKPDIMTVTTRAVLSLKDLAGATA
ncbi:MAG TPA: hypothetical protein VHA14_13910, partial [Bryobacteraceae bacterium]|nr:hypothetical protein [Bryobacteraceae bacterium]